MKPTVVMLGAGGHAGVLLEILLEQGIPLEGYIAPSAEGSRLGNVPWLGPDAALDGLDAASVSLVNGLGLAKASTARGTVFENARALGFTFLTIVDATAIVKASADLGEGAQVLAGAIVGTGARIGADTIINTGAIVDHDCVVGPHAHIATGAALAGGVTVGAGSHIGLGARVIQGITVGSGSTIGAGAVVLSDVADRSTAVGVPATSRSST
ncbi:acetyltransferase [Glaciihabitans arcticus]|nr:acetyltransferase [Glaciihabitans arcticus]